MAFALISKPKQSPTGPAKPAHKNKPPQGPNFFGLQAPTSATPIIQPKLKVSQPNDKYEQEADRVADQVMRMPNTAVAGTASPGVGAHGSAPVMGAPSSIQRACCAECAAEGEKKLQRTPLSNIPGPPRISALNGPVAARFPLSKQEAAIQRQAMEENEEEMLQMKSADGGSAVPTVTPRIEAGINSLKGGEQPLPESTRAFFEPRFGVDFSGVRVHSDGWAAEAAQSVQAKAFTTGQNIVFGAGEYSPDSAHGRRLLAHELTHVVQQAGRDGSIMRQKAAGAGVGACPGHERNEVRKSRTGAGHLGGDIWDIGAGRLLIADFGVGRRSVKQSTARDPVLIAWLQEFESNTSYELRVLGYDDCVGEPAKRVSVRAGRAQAVHAMLGPSASGRVTSVGPAPLGNHVNDNTTVQARAQNRGVVIEFKQKFTFPPDRVVVPRPKRTTPPTADCSKAQQAEVASALPLAKAMVDKALDKMRGPKTPALRAMLRKYFNDDSVSTDLKVIAGLKRLKSGLSTSITYECENPGSVMYNYFCDGRTAYTRVWVAMNIHLCAAAFGRSNSALAETLIHENSHMFDFTDDEEYCSLTSGCSSGLSRWDAYDNADSFSTFAQDVYLNL